MSDMKTLLQLAGGGQLLLALATLSVPRMLGWREELARLRPLNRQIFTTYAGYILCTNLCFGLLSLLAPAWLLDGTPLAAAVAWYIAAYWGVRLVLQFVYYQAPPGAFYTTMEVLFSLLFAYLTGVYALCALR